MSDTPAPDRAAQLREQRRHNRLLAEQMRGRRLERQHQLLEAQLAYDWVQPYSDLLDRLRNGEPEIAGPTAVWNRRYGRNYPLFQSEQELNLLRAPARILCATNSYAIGLLEGLTSYVIGSGYTYRVTPTDPSVPPGLVEAGQDILDEFADRTEWFGGELPGLEEELFWRSCEDGEYFLGHYCLEDGRTDVRTFEPEQVTQPPGGDQREWLFGIRTEPDDVQKPLGYYVYFGEDSSDGEEMSPEQVTHFRRNVKRWIKRGLTDFSFDTLDTLNLAGRLRVSLGEGAAEQAAIVSVMQYETGTQQEVQAFLDGDADFQELDPLTQTLQDVKRQKKGSHLHIPKGQQYASPPNAQNGNTHLAILSMCIRGAGVRWNAPEWLGSADASNTNYASSLTAESPFVRTVRRRQRAYGSAFRRTWWAVLRNWCERRGGIKAGGRLYSWQDVQRYLDIHVEPPSPETRNKQEEAQRGSDRDHAGSAEPAAIRAGARPRLGADPARERRVRPGAGQAATGPATPGTRPRCSA